MSTQDEISADAARADRSAPPWRMTLNRPFEEALGTDGVRAYVQALVATGRESPGRSAEEVAELLRAKLDAAGIEVPEPSYERMAGELVQANGCLVVVSADGVVLHEDADRSDAAEPMTDEPGSLEPEDPDRPIYS